MKGPTPGRLRDYVRRRLGLGWYLDEPGDGRPFPQISASSLVWALLMGKVLRVASFCGLETWVRMAREPLGVERGFGDDTLAYFTERLSVDRLRMALACVLRRAKRNKVFENTALIGLAVDGTGAGRSQGERCCLCRPQGGGYGHKLSAICVVGAGLDLPFGVEYYEPGTGELTASKVLVRRAVNALGRRFADYVIGDGLYGAAPFIDLAQEHGLEVVVRLKDNLPDLFQAARSRFEGTRPHGRFGHESGWVEYWDADDFEPWEGLGWAAVRVLRYRHVRSDGCTFEAYWVTSFSRKRVGSKGLFRVCKSRWAIENQGFNDAKNRYGLKHIPHHEPNSLRINALLTFLAMCVERLYRLRYLRRGSHPALTAIELQRILILSLGRAPEVWDTS